MVETAHTYLGLGPRESVPTATLPTVITGELKSKIDKVWDTFWTGGISNPLEVIEQITSLLFIRRLDDLHTRAENMANRLKKPIENPIFPIGQDDLRWSKFKHFEPGVMFKVVDERVFPFLRQLGDIHQLRRCKVRRGARLVRQCDVLRGRNQLRQDDLLREVCRLLRSDVRRVPDPVR